MGENSAFPQGNILQRECKVPLAGQVSKQPGTVLVNYSDLTS